MDTITAQPARPRKWYEIWLDVWTHPGVETFRSLLLEPENNSSRGFKWGAVTAAVSYFVSTLATMILSQNSSFTGLLCAVVAAPIGAVIGLAISAGIYHGIAKLFGGSGTWDKLVFCIAAIEAPYLLFSSLFGNAGILLLKVIPLLVVFGLVALAISIYMIALFVSAINAVENIGTGKSLLTIFIPVIIGVILAICIASSLPTLSK